MSEIRAREATWHPSCHIHPHAKIGKNNVIGPGVVIGPCVEIGEDNYFGPFTVIGTMAEYKGEVSKGLVKIGNGNHITEHVTVHQSMTPERPTTIGNKCYIMTKSHIGHDAVLEDEVTLASGAIIGGHSVIQTGANIGLAAVVHQKRVVGRYAFIGLNSSVTRSIPPYVKAYGVPARAEGINVVGLKRRGHDDSFIAAAQYWLNFNKTDVNIRNEMSSVIEEQIEAWRGFVKSLEGK